jgi:hypothetical protein
MLRLNQRTRRMLDERQLQIFGEEEILPGTISVGLSVPAIFLSLCLGTVGILLGAPPRRVFPLELSIRRACPARKTTETNRIHLVLFGMQNRTFGSYLAANDRILISLMKERALGLAPVSVSLCFCLSLDRQKLQGLLSACQAREDLLPGSIL